MKKNEEYMLEHAGLCRAADRLEPQMFDEYGVQTVSYTHLTLPTSDLV